MDNFDFVKVLVSEEMRVHMLYLLDGLLFFLCFNPNSYDIMLTSREEVPSDTKCILFANDTPLVVKEYIFPSSIMKTTYEVNVSFLKKPKKNHKLEIKIYLTNPNFERKKRIWKLWKNWHYSSDQMITWIEWIPEEVLLDILSFVTATTTT
jgi:hypothetical protein